MARDDQPTFIIGNGAKAKPGDVVFHSGSKGCPAKVLLYATCAGYGYRIWRLRGRQERVMGADLYGTQADARAKRLADLVELEGRQVKALKATQAEIRKLAAAAR